MTTIALIPARGGSKGVPRKNIKYFCGKPLIYWSIKLAQESKYIDRVIVSTEDIEIAEIAKDCMAEVPFLRPKQLSLDESLGIDPVIHALEQLPDASDLLLLQPTSPLRRLKDIDGIFKIRSKSNSESAVSICSSGKPLDLFYKINEDHRISSLTNNNNIKPRQFYTDNYILNGALYLSTRESILKHHSLINKDTVGYIMPVQFSIDIDTPLDWKIAEFLMSQLE